MLAPFKFLPIGQAGILPLISALRLKQYVADKVADVFLDFAVLPNHDDEVPGQITLHSKFLAKDLKEAKVPTALKLRSHYGLRETAQLIFDEV